MSSVAVATEIKNSVVKSTNKKGKKMSDTQTVVQNPQNPEAQSAPETKETQKTVFDLNKFDNILLKKKFQVPVRPGSVREVLDNVLGGKMEDLLSLIHEGLVSRAQNQAYASNEGWFTTDEDGDITTEAYSGNFASDSKRDMINAAVLTLAKLNGYDKNLSKEDKKAKKEAAMKFLRDNPAMLGGLQG